MAKKAYRVRNWKHYNKSLIERGSLIFWFSEKITDSWQSAQKNNVHGNQKYSDMAITCGLTIRQLFRLTLRSAQGMLRIRIRVQTF